MADTTTIATLRESINEIGTVDFNLATGFVTEVHLDPEAKKIYTAINILFRVRAGAIAWLQSCIEEWEQD
ncbi:MAG: hypothetical protein HC781_21940 [Leptolyngbyaceae cyanobacterium CSU_1_4]|nr:hypothetical protein [Leptolyngbyaceae cyanobacterium CSU_1_4]